MLFQIADETESHSSDSMSDKDSLKAIRDFCKIHEPERKSVNSCGGSKQILPDRTSDWKLTHANLLHVFYKNDYLLNPTDVLQTMQMLHELDEKQKQYVSSLQNFLKFDSNLHEFCHSPVLVKEKLDRLLPKQESLNELQTCNEVSVSTLKGDRFITALYRLHDKIQKQRRARYRLNEGMFTQLVLTLGEICYLEGERCSSGDESIWCNLRGCKRVISNPDCRFYKQGHLMNDNCAPVKPTTVVSIHEVKNAKKFEGLEHPEKKRKRKRFKRSHFSTEESESCSSSGISRWLSAQLLDMSKEPIPEIIADLNEQVLGQHAGELLLDLHEYGLDDHISQLTSPGLIIDGTKVYFTLLEMSKSHYEKLCKNVELDETDRAIIYYSRPLDILHLESRNTLIENFVRLNNIY
ncbi:Hypothetical predicted protein [Mytilus galloprovincialis]|uniref:Uncharacterized protein n=1 Tax=Mytilus galloprovincialis TaxID=29158 RepID=A0A8B6GJ83_MYTGA|nr:Hypothetical predicted protein [Mytilus galloprovincialis]